MRTSSASLDELSSILYSSVLDSFRFFTPLTNSPEGCLAHLISIIKWIVSHRVFPTFRALPSSFMPLVTNTGGLLAVLQRAVIIGGTVGICKRVWILWILAYLVFLLINTGRITLFSMLLHIRWKGASGAALRVRG